MLCRCIRRQIETAVHGTFPWVDGDDIDGEDEDWPGPEDEYLNEIG